MNLPIVFNDSPLKWSRFLDWEDEAGGFQGDTCMGVTAFIKKDNFGHYHYTWAVSMQLSDKSKRRPQFNGISDTLEQALTQCHKCAFNMVMVKFIYGEQSIDRWRESVNKIYDNEGL